MGQQDNTRVNSVLYLHAVPPPSIYVCCTVPNLFRCHCVPVYQLSLLSLPGCAFCSPRAQGRKSKEGSRVRLMTRDSSCLRPGWWTERAGLAFSCQPPGKACAQCPSTALLSSQASGHPLTLEWHRQCCFLPPECRFAVSIQAWLFASYFTFNLCKIKATLTGPTNPVFWGCSE